MRVFAEVGRKDFEHVRAKILEPTTLQTMGVKDLWTKVLGLFSKQNKQKLSKCAGWRVAVDFSCWLHAAIHSSTATCLALTNHPPFPRIDDLLEILDDRHRKITDNGIDPIYVFDGLPHLMKSDEHKRRSAEKDAQELFARIFHNRLPNYKGMIDQ
jgi:5'-3' exonuclease